MSGRSLVVYEECHPQCKENNPAVHKTFLNRLKQMFPASVKPIIVTDAGFRAEWFNHILFLDWDFVGRVRNRNLVLLNNESCWRLSQTMFSQATGKPNCIGEGLLTKSSKVPVSFILYKAADKNRHKLNRSKKRSNTGKSNEYSKTNKEPWVLVTSLSADKTNAIHIVNIYRQRMRIEENFRDTKCPHYGLGLKKSLTRTTARMSILLLIAAIATFAAWIAGVFTTFIGKATDFQAHSAKVKSALSKVYLGREAIKRGFSITKKQLRMTLQLMYQINLNILKEADL
jgi:hypothetical protein